jgi:hypothetical protein
LIFRKNFLQKKLARNICEVLDGPMDSDVPDVDTRKPGLSVPEVFWIVSRVE